MTTKSDAPFGHEPDPVDSVSALVAVSGPEVYGC
jgi:hypothetical protein